jgi:hypothetical protein
MRALDPRLLRYNRAARRFQLVATLFRNLTAGLMITDA